MLKAQRKIKAKIWHILPKKHRKPPKYNWREQYNYFAGMRTKPWKKIKWRALRKEQKKSYHLIQKKNKYFIYELW